MPSADFPRFKPVEATLAQQLEEKCQENGWLKRGGYDWQDDPYLEEYPYDFCEAGSVSELKNFFSHGNWAIRQGVVFDDLAFVQQVNGGDEWWTLKRDGDEWRDFESASCGLMIERGGRSFERFIASIRTAIPEECARLEYRLPDSIADMVSEMSDGPCEGGLRKLAVEQIAKDPEKRAALHEAVASSDREAAASLDSEVRRAAAVAGTETLAEKTDSIKEASAALEGDMRARRPAPIEH